MSAVTYELVDDVARIVLDDGKVNAMNPALFAGINDALDRAEQDAAKTVIFCGREDFLSAGLDLKLIPTLSPEKRRDMTDQFARTMLRILALPVPSIAVVSGHAVAGGALLAFACDYRVAVDGDYRLQMNEMLIGLPLPAWAVLICDHVIPPGERTRALLHACSYAPGEALKLGMLNELAPDVYAALKAAMRLAEELATVDRGAYAITKQRMRQPAIEQALSLLERDHAESA